MHMCVRFEIEKDLKNGPRVYEKEKKEKRPFWLMRIYVRFEIERDLENGPRVYEKEKKGKKSKSENNITMHFCTMIAYMLIVNEIRVFTNMLGMLYEYTYSYIFMMNG